MLVGALVVPIFKHVPWATIVADIGGSGILTELLLNLPFGVGRALLLRFLLRRRV